MKQKIELVQYSETLEGINITLRFHSPVRSWWERLLGQNPRVGEVSFFSTKNFLQDIHSSVFHSKDDVYWFSQFYDLMRFEVVPHVPSVADHLVWIERSEYVKGSSDLLYRGVYVAQEAPFDISYRSLYVRVP